MRYKFAKDNDGHNYLIPSDTAKEFELWIAYMEGQTLFHQDGIEMIYRGQDFNQFRIDSISDYSFEKPKKER